MLGDCVKIGDFGLAVEIKDGRYRSSSEVRHITTVALCDKITQISLDICNLEFWLNAFLDINGLI